MLVDTSVWIEHLRHREETLSALLEAGEVQCHPFVIGELTCGILANREEVLGLLSALPQVPQARNAEVLMLIESNQLMGRGIGWVDAHLLASARLAHTQLWTLDRRLGSIAREFGVAE